MKRNCKDCTAIHEENNKFYCKRSWAWEGKPSPLCHLSEPSFSAAGCTSYEKKR